MVTTLQNGYLFGTPRIDGVPNFTRRKQFRIPVRFPFFWFPIRITINPLAFPNHNVRNPVRSHPFHPNNTDCFFCYRSKDKISNLLGFKVQSSVIIPSRRKIPSSQNGLKIKHETATFTCRASGRQIIRYRLERHFKYVQSFIRICYKENAIDTAEIETSFLGPHSVKWDGKSP